MVAAQPASTGDQAAASGSSAGASAAPKETVEVAASGAGATTTAPAVAPSTVPTNRSAPPTASTDAADSVKAPAQKEKSKDPYNVGILENIMDSRCKMALCIFKRWGRIGFEPFADIPIGGTWFVGGKDKLHIDGLNSNQQIRSQFGRNLSPSLAGGARIFGVNGLVSLGFGFSLYKVNSYTLERSDKFGGGSFTIGSNSVTASPAVYLGLIEDAISISWTRVSYTNDGPRFTFSDQTEVAPGAKIATGNIITLGVAPIAAFRAAIGVGKSDSKSDATKPDTTN